METPRKKMYKNGNKPSKCTSTDILIESQFWHKTCSKRNYSTNENERPQSYSSHWNHISGRGAALKCHSILCGNTFPDKIHFVRLYLICLHTCCDDSTRSFPHFVKMSCHHVNGCYLVRSLSLLLFARALLASFAWKSLLLHASPTQSRVYTHQFP